MIESIASSSNKAALSTALASNDELGRDAFLRLLTVQLQNQDPLDPVKNEDFIAQLAQFSSLEQLTLINQNLEGDQDAQATTEVREAVNSNTAIALIGRQVQVHSDTITYPGVGSVKIGYNLEGSADTVRIRIVNQQGDVIRMLVDGSPQQGNASILWDGKDADGNTVDPDTYAIVPSADYQGTPTTVTAGMAGIAKGVRYQDGFPILITEDGEAPLSAISRVSEGS